MFLRPKGRRMARYILLNCCAVSGGRKDFLALWDLILRFFQAAPVTSKQRPAVFMKVGPINFDFELVRSSMAMGAPTARAWRANLWLAPEKRMRGFLAWYFRFSNNGRLMLFWSSFILPRACL